MQAAGPTARNVVICPPFRSPEVATEKSVVSIGTWTYFTTVILVRDLITAHILVEDQIVSESTRCETPSGWLTATSDCHGETPAQEPVPADVVVATVVVGGAVEVAGTVVATGVVEVTGILAVVVTVPPPDPPVSAFFTETSYLLLAST